MKRSIVRPRSMRERDCGFIPVIASNGDGALVGVVTDRDIAVATYIQGKPPLRSRYWA